MNREDIIFLSNLCISSNNIIKILEYCKKNNLSFFEFLDSDPENIKGLIRPLTFMKIRDSLNSYKSLCSLTYEKCQKLKARISTILDEDFPGSLKFLEDPPAILYVRGNKLDTENNLAMVGSRKHTSYGNYVVNKFIDQLSNYNFTIVSGMAYGIDALSHKIALEKEMGAIAVLGNGVDIIYPRANTSLYMNLVNKGTIVSEYPFGMKASNYTFPQRNRIISALSRAVVVIEAKEKSGSLITARLAAEQGREVFAVPGNINSPYSGGTNLLIRDGAIPLLDIEDILAYFPEVKKKNEQEKNIINLSEDEILLLNFIKDGHNNIEEICNMSNFDVFYINSLLTKLELKSVIEKISLTEYRII